MHQRQVARRSGLPPRPGLAGSGRKRQRPERIPIRRPARRRTGTGTGTTPRTGPRARAGPSGPGWRPARRQSRRPGQRRPATEIDDAADRATRFRISRSSSLQFSNCGWRHVSVRKSRPRSSVSPTSDRSRGRLRRPRRAEGASLVLTYQGERLEENVRELAATLDARHWCCRATSPATTQIDAVFAAIEREYGGLDFLVHGVGVRASARIWRGRSSRPRARDSACALDISAYSLVALARRAVPLMERRGGGSILTLTLPGQRARVHQLQRDGRGQGRARIVGALPGAPTSVRRTFASTRFRPGRSRRWRRRASPASRASCRPTATARRSAARSRRAKSPTPRCSCSARPAAPSPPKC